MKDYNIGKKKSQGRIESRISFFKDGKRILDITWNPNDKEAETKAFKTADMTVLKNKLNYKTRIIKPIKN